MTGHLWVTLLLTVALTAPAAATPLAPADDRARDRAEGYPVAGPTLLTTAEMIDVARERVAAGTEPFLSAWRRVLSAADAALPRTPDPYHDEGYLEYFHKGRAQAMDTRSLALAHEITGESRYADKAREFLTAWAEDGLEGGDPGGSQPINRGLVVARVVTIFADSFALLYDEFSPAERDLIRDWLASQAEPILDSHELWIDPANDYFDGQYWNNHIGGHVMGLTAIGVATGDRELLRYAVSDPRNPRDAVELIDGVIVMPGDELWYRDPTYTNGEPAPLPGEVWDRYRVVQGHGIHYALLHLRFLTLTAEMVHNASIPGLPDLYGHVGPGGETIELAYDVYADWFITGDPAAVNDGYYATGEQVQWGDLAMYELAHRRYPSNARIKSALEYHSRVVNDVQTFRRSAVLTHGLDDVPPPKAYPALGVTSWSFDEPDNMEGWVVRKSAEANVADGVLSLRITGVDPGLMSPDRLGMDASEYTRVRIRVRNSTTDARGQLFWLRDQDSGYSGGRSVGIGPMETDSEFHEYEIDLSAHPEWSDRIRQVRWDPVNQATEGTFEIDHIEFLQAD